DGPVAGESEPYERRQATPRSTDAGARPLTVSSPALDFRTRGRADDPAAQSHSRGPCLAARAPRRSHPRGDVMRKAGKVLVVDDYEANIRALGQLLERANYEVFTATNGADALDVVKADRPDLVLLDVVMPGLDVCSTIKKDAATCLTPVVLISGTQERETRIAGLEAGADDFLNKPVDPEELFTRVRSLMRLK